MKKVTVLVAAHKSFPQKNIPGYLPVQVGAALAQQELGYQRDDEGENISRKNPQYCELTAHYWAWKNLESDIVGLVHYRRYFVQDMYAKDPQRLIPDAQEICRLLEQYTIVLPKMVNKLARNGTLYKNMPRSQQNQPLLLLEDVVRDLAPDYMPEFEKYAYGHRVSFGNMLLAEKSVFDAYSAWMFPILEEYEKRGAEYMQQIPRLCGFLSEYLLCAWVEHNIPQDKILFMDVYNTEENTKTFVYRLRRILVRMGIFEPVSRLVYSIYYKLCRC